MASFPMLPTGGARAARRATAITRPRGRRKMVGARCVRLGLGAGRAANRGSRAATTTARPRPREQPPRTISGRPQNGPRRMCRRPREKITPTTLRLEGRAQPAANPAPQRQPAAGEQSDREQRPRNRRHRRHLGPACRAEATECDPARESRERRRRRRQSIRRSLRGASIEDLAVGGRDRACQVIVRAIRVNGSR